MGLILKGFYSLWGAESIRKRLKEMIDVTISVVEATNLKELRYSVKVLVQR
jgi:hypothetical protein